MLRSDSSALGPSLRANGSRECAPDDRLREAIHSAASGKVDCFVAESIIGPAEGRTRWRLAMTAGSDGIANFDFAEQHKFIVAEERSFLRQVTL